MSTNYRNHPKVRKTRSFSGLPILLTSQEKYFNSLWWSKGNYLRSLRVLKKIAPHKQYVGDLRSARKDKLNVTRNSGSSLRTRSLMAFHNARHHQHAFLSITMVVSIISNCAIKSSENKYRHSVTFTLVLVLLHVPGTILKTSYCPPQI